MPKSLFARLIAHSSIILVALLLASGLVLDRYLTEREVDRLADELARHGRVTAEELADHRGELQHWIQRRGGAAGIRFTLIDRHGAVLADSQHDPAGMNDHSDRPEIIEAYRGRVGRSMRASPTLGLDLLYVALPGDPVVRVAMPMFDVHAYLWQIRHRVLAAAVPALLLALALAYLLARSLSRRFSGISTSSARLAAGDYETVPAVEGNDELTAVERSLVGLRDELRQQVGTLERDRQRLRTLLDGLPDGVLVLDREKRLSVVNETARALLRLPEDRILGLTGAEILREQQVIRALDDFATDGSAVPNSAPFRVAWPEPARELDVTLHPLMDETGAPGILMVMHDVTLQAHLERVRTDFVANLSHELRTPLTAVRGAAETLLDGASADPEALDRFLQTIRRHSLRLETLLADVSDLARVEAGGDDDDVEQFDARTVVESVLDLFSAEAGQREVKLRHQVPNAPLSIRSDPGKIESILVNLVQNGVRYTPAGGKVEVWAEPAPGGARFRVADTGIGIPAQDLPRVTERFYRVDPSRSRAQGGTGLGLSIVKHMVESLDGTFTIESEYGRGTQVQVHIPHRSR